MVLAFRGTKNSARIWINRGFTLQVRALQCIGRVKIIVRAMLKEKRARALPQYRAKA